MVTPEVRCELVELVKYEDRQEEVIGVEFKDPRVNWGMGVRGGEGCCSSSMFLKTIFLIVFIIVMARLEVLRYSNEFSTFLAPPSSRKKGRKSLFDPFINHL